MYKRQAYEDKNANGKRDAGEPTMSGAWLKLSGGGSWFVLSLIHISEPTRPY